ncbi:acyl-CoA dehydrogenase family protein [Conexibacter stalactiti]|uniref:Acyl-CoA dehydrogenase family protein n=1 Tax=Conexibacter stalactiti TaxID=1940611 RepID=A0ABU4HQE2_9ACTN|nr:acyl-CoA dehydrogenase family protein [Conexibacter stalactiti]MDW5594259.1 acyl-CoA dehydrogenase family protein [Conexibacter stalactiti]MEC5034901.1 acyl-CoA dehydrogenase family protein [Conexibacter stalactiti]
MDPRLPAEIDEFGRSTAEMLRRRTGFALARAAQTGAAEGGGAEAGGEDPRAAAAELLSAIDADGIDPRATVEEALAAAELCRAAGAVVLPAPVAQRLCRDEDGGGFAVVASLDAPVVVDHADLLDRVVTLDGRRGRIAARTPIAGKLSRYAAEVTVEPLDGEAAPLDVALWLNLQAAYVNGALETAVALTVEHTSQRRQFGKPLSSFQSLRFQVVEASLACRGLLQLLRFSLWRLHEAPDDTLVDALGLRLQAQEAARRVLAVAHQLHGAMGFANEHDLPFVTRGIQTALRLPLDYEATTDALLRRVDAGGFDTLYGRFTPGVVGAPAPTTPV